MTAPSAWADNSTAVPSTASAATGRNLAVLAARAWRLRVSGSQLVPSDGPVILAANHTAFLDVLMLLAASPRPVHVLAESELFAPPFGAALRGAGQIMVDGDGPDRAALQTATAVLEDGGVIGLFPEGPRGDGEVRHVHHEVAYLAARTGAAIIPVAILGTRRAGGGKDSLPRLRTPVDVVFGEPVLPRIEGDARRRAVLARSGERLRQVLADHVRTAHERTGQTLPGPLPDTSHQHRSNT